MWYVKPESRVHGLWRFDQALLGAEDDPRVGVVVGTTPHAMRVPLGKRILRGKGGLQELRSAIHSGNDLGGVNPLDRVLVHARRAPALREELSVLLDLLAQGIFVLGEKLSDLVRVHGFEAHGFSVVIGA